VNDSVHSVNGKVSQKFSLKRQWAERLEWIRQDKGLSYAALGAPLRYSKAQVWKLINGDQEDLTEDFIERLEAKFSVNRDWLLGGVGDPYVSKETKTPVNETALSEREVDYRTPRSALGPITPEFLEMDELHRVLVNLAVFCQRCQSTTLADVQTHRDFALANIGRIATELQTRAANSAQDIADAVASRPAAEVAAEPRPGLPPKPGVGAPSGHRSSPSGGASRASTAQPGTQEKVPK